MVDKYIYEVEFKDKIEDAKTYAAAIVKQFKDNYDDEATALQILQNYYGYSTFEAYENAAYMNYLQNEAIKAYIKRKVDDSG